MEYQKQNFGPVARHLSWAVNELSKEGSIKVQKRDYFGFKKTDYILVRKPSTNRLSNLEVHLLNDVIDFVCERSAKEISELSHKAPWEAVEIGGTIPYYSAYGLLPSALSEADIDNAVAEIKELRPVIEHEINERGIQ